MSNYIREIVKQFYGDQSLAAQYLGFARKLLGELAERSGDIETTQRRVILPDGADITVGFLPGIARVMIDVRNVSTGKQCYYFVESGGIVWNGAFITVESIESADTFSVPAPFIKSSISIYLILLKTLRDSWGITMKMEWLIFGSIGKIPSNQ